MHHGIVKRLKEKKEVPSIEAIPCGRSQDKSVWHLICYASAKK